LRCWGTRFPAAAFPIDTWVNPIHHQLEHRSDAL
jgi:hypothetical protein